MATNDSAVEQKATAATKDGVDIAKKDQLKIADPGVCRARDDAFTKKGLSHGRHAGHDREKAAPYLPSCSIDLPAAQTEDAHDTKSESRKTDAPIANLTPEGQALTKLAADKFRAAGYPQEFAKFAENVKRFEDRAKKDCLSPQEVKDTYKGIERMVASIGAEREGVTADGVQSSRQRMRIAEQLMSMVAMPEDRNQGDYKTCSMASVEGMLVTGPNSDPSKVTNMVADVSLTGQTNGNGIKVSIDRQSMQSVGELADNRTPGENKTRLAENIFRITAANVYFGIKREEGDPQENLQFVSRKEGDHLIYVPHKPTGSKDDRDWQAYAKASDGFPGISAEGQSMILNKITGKDYSQRIIADGTFTPKDSKWFTTVASGEELSEHLKKLQADGKYPVLMTVMGFNKSFNDVTLAVNSNQTFTNPFSALDLVSPPQRGADLAVAALYFQHDLMITDRLLRENGSGRLFSRTGRESKDYGTIMYQLNSSSGSAYNVKVPEKELYADAMPSPPQEVLRNLRAWADTHKDESGFMQSNKYLEALSLANMYTTTGALQMETGVNPALLAEYQQAARSVDSLLDDLPPTKRSEVLQLEKKNLRNIWNMLSPLGRKEVLEAQQRHVRDNPALQPLYDGWRRLLEQ